MIFSTASEKLCQKAICTQSPSHGASLSHIAEYIFHKFLFEEANCYQNWGEQSDKNLTWQLILRGASLSSTEQIEEIYVQKHEAIL